MPLHRSRDPNTATLMAKLAHVLSSNRMPQLSPVLARRSYPVCSRGTTRDEHAVIEVRERPRDLPRTRIGDQPWQIDTQFGRSSQQHVIPVEHTSFGLIECEPSRVPADAREIMIRRANVCEPRSFITREKRPGQIE